MATVITSLASALPIVGTSIVGWLWGGFSVEWRLDKWMFFNFLHPKDFENFPFFLENFAYCGNNFFMDGYNPLEECFILLCMIGFVKMPSIHSQSADVWAVQVRRQSQTFMTAPASQRLNAEEQAWLVGFYEADGWFGVFINGKYVQYEFGIEVHKRDAPLLHQIKNKWKLSGTVRHRKDRPEMVVFKVRNKKDLTTKIVPIFDKYPIMGPKIKKYLFFRFHLIENQTVLSQELQEKIMFCETFQKEKDFQSFEQKRFLLELLQRPYFDSWLVGFINGEGCFSIYQSKKEKGLVCSFDIAQKLGGFLLLTAIQHRMHLKTTIYKDITDCYKLKVSSVFNCNQVLKFLCSQPLKLKGYKRIQYIKWAKQLRVNPRYSSISVPPKLSCLNIIDLNKLFLCINLFNNA